MEFRWNAWNVDHVAQHGVAPSEAEEVVNRARSPYPQHRGDGRWLVWGQSAAGRLLQVSYVFDENDVAFVIHARPLTENEKRRYRRRGKQ